MPVLAQRRKATLRLTVYDLAKGSQPQLATVRPALPTHTMQARSPKGSRTDTTYGVAPNVQGNEFASDPRSQSTTTATAVWGTGMGTGGFGMCTVPAAKKQSTKGSMAKLLNEFPAKPMRLWLLTFFSKSLIEKNFHGSPCKPKASNLQTETHDAGCPCI